MEPTRQRSLRTTIGGLVLLVTATALSGRAGAETIIRFDGSANVVSRAAAPAYALEHGVEARPALTLQVGTPRLVWRAGYLLAYDLDAYGESTSSHFASLSLAAEPSPRTLVTAGASFTQGGVAFRISQPPADAGRPALLDPGGGVLLTGTFRQTLGWEASPSLRLGQELRASQAARPDAFDDRNRTVAGLLRLDWLRQSSSLGLGGGASLASLKPLDSPSWQPHLDSWTCSLLGAWSLDVDERWSGQLTAGLQLVRVVGQAPDALSPAGGLVIRYAAGPGEASLTAQHAILPMLETGTLSESDEVVLRATMSLDPDRRRVLAGSAGFVSLRPPIVGPAVAAASTALRGDVGLVWGLSTWLQATVRYSISHQYWSGTSSTVHVLLAGLTFHFSNADRLPPVPAPGQRVDGSDSVRFRTEPGRP